MIGRRRRPSEGSQAATGYVGRDLHQIYNSTVTIAAPPDAGRITNLPPRNRWFVGRDAAMEKLSRLVFEARDAVVTVHGLGGIGKSQLALEFAYRNLDEFGVVWWVRAESATSARLDLAVLAERLGQKVEGDLDASVEGLRIELARRHDWLLVLDNIEAPEMLAWLAPPSVGRIVTTSRSPNWHPVATPLALTTLTSGESMALLTGGAAGRAADTDSAGEIAAELDHLPLGLAQAAAYLATHPSTSPADYLTLFRARRETFLRRNEKLAGYPASVATTWLIHFEALRNESPAAIGLLHLLSFFQPDRFPLGLVMSAAGQGALPRVLADARDDEEAWHECVAALADTSLVVCGADGFASMHRLVQEVTRMNLTPQERKRWVERSLKLLDTAFPEDLEDPEGWPRAALLVENVAAVADLAGQHKIGKDLASDLLNRAAIYYGANNDPATARVLLERGLRLKGKQDIQYVQMSSNLGIALNELGRYAEAHRLAVQTHAVARGIWGPRSVQASRSLTAVANALQNLEDYDGALATHREIMAIDERNFGIDAKELIPTLVNVGNVLVDVDRDEEALRFYRRAMAIATTVHGKRHLELVGPLDGLARVAARGGAVDEAEACLQESLIIEKKYWGSANGEVATTLMLLGRLAERRHRRVVALGHYTQALEVFEVAYGSGHWKTIAAADDVRRMSRRRLLRSRRRLWEWNSGEDIFGVRDPAGSPESMREA